MLSFLVLLSLGWEPAEFPQGEKSQVPLLPCLRERTPKPKLPHPDPLPEGEGEFV